MHFCKEVVTIAKEYASIWTTATTSMSEPMELEACRQYLSTPQVSHLCNDIKCLHLEVYVCTGHMERIGHVNQQLCGLIAGALLNGLGWLLIQQTYHRDGVALDALSFSIWGQSQLNNVENPAPLHPSKDKIVFRFIFLLTPPCLCLNRPILVSSMCKT